MLNNNLSLQQLNFDCPAELGSQQLFDIRAAVRISANMRLYQFRFDTMLLNNEAAVMFGLRDRQQFRRALGLSILSDAELDDTGDVLSSFCVPAELVAQTQILLGTGAFGSVYSCQLEGRTLCVKEPKRTDLDVVQVHAVVAFGAKSFLVATARTKSRHIVCALSFAGTIERVRSHQ